MKYISLIAFLVSLQGFCGSITIAERGKTPQYSIILPADPTPSVRYAAEELQEYVSRITGTRLAITDSSSPLSIRLVPTDRYGDEGFNIKVDKNKNLVISGGAVRGVLYGVYEILETYGGVGWFSSWHTVVPKKDRFTIPDTLSDTQRPAFAMREPLWFDAFKPDFASHLRMNGDSMRLGDIHGGNTYRFGGGLGNAHTLPHLVPAEEFFDSHPEYFALVDGVRVRDRQLCLSNPDVLRIVTERVLERIRRDPKAKYFGVSQQDTMGYCTCEECKKIDDYEESPAGSVIHFVNKVAEAVEKEFPDKIIETLAYQYSRKPPRHVKARHNVMPCLCTIECDFYRPLDGSPYRENKAFLEDLKGWGRVTDNLYLWDYVTNFMHYDLPFANIMVLQPNLKTYRDAGVTSVFAEGAYQGRHADFAELKTYLLAKLMWNPDQDAGKLIDRFLAGYYGKAAPYVKKYLKNLHSLPRNSETQHLGIYEQVRTPILTDAFLEDALKTWLKAMRTVKDDKALLYNVRTSALSVVYTILYRRATNASKKVWCSANPQSFVPPANTAKLLALFEEILKEAGDTFLSESGLRQEKYLALIRSLNNVSIPAQGTDKVKIEEDVLHISDSAACEIVPDADATNGKAIKIPATHRKWCVTLRFDTVATDPDAEYTLRFRAKVVRRGGASGNAQAFSAGVYDDDATRTVRAKEPRLSATADGYQWYELVTWKPQDGQYFWFAPGWFDANTLRENPDLEAVYLDCLELERAGQR
ncbi:MAG: DUF4838 domain-containing protein [Kiritimatiellae bacterium]|nr:DUF4838 domain-containing protein [Kiritimatiellia bacterium]